MKAAEALRRVLQGEPLERSEVRALCLQELGPELDPIALAGLLGALAARGETTAEISGAAEALRSLMLPFEHDAQDAIDTCGTGGDGLASFNLSTAAAIVAAAAGARVIKHGNRSSSARCGSADLLEHCGISLELTAGQARICLEEVGIVFLYAPAWHPALRQLAPIRKALGVRTLFNYLGPLCNPGRVRRQLLGVAQAERVEDYAQALRALGHERALVVHGAGGADELTLAGGNRWAAVGGDPLLLMDATDLGLTPAPVAALRGGDIAENTRLLFAILAGQVGPLRDAVLLNSAAALWVAGQVTDMAAGVACARETIAGGRALRKLEQWVRTSRVLQGRKG